MARHLTDPRALLALLPSADAPAIVDVRTAEDAAADPTRLPAAVRMSLAAIEAGEGPAAGVAVAYCQKGGKISQLAAAALRARGVAATALAGGHLGWVAAGLPVQPLEAPEGGAWVMRNDPGWVDLVALWRLLRLGDSTARVRAVAADQVAAAARVTGARIVGAEAVGALHGAAGWPDPTGGAAVEALLRGRLARVGEPVAALDLVDDAVAGAGGVAGAGA